MRGYTVVGVHITERAKNAVDVQRVLTERASNIRTRLGLHPAHGESACSEGLILLDTVGAEEEIDALCRALHRLVGVQVQRMYFSCPTPTEPDP